MPGAHEGQGGGGHRPLRGAPGQEPVQADWRDLQGAEERLLSSLLLGETEESRAGSRPSEAVGQT